MRKTLILNFVLVASIFSCTSGKKGPHVYIPEFDLNFNSKEIRLSKEAEAYIESVVVIMRKDALHRDELDFNKIKQVIRFYADGAESVEDTHQAIEKSLPLLKDRHTYFMTATEIKESLGLDGHDIEEIKKGRAPHAASAGLDSLKKSLNYATGQILKERVAYLSIPAFDNLFSESMTMFADSLQTIIRQFDQRNLRGWIVDLRGNHGGAAMPMIAGLGPLLDEDNTFYTVDKRGKILSRSYYKEGGYYDVDAGEKETRPLIKMTDGYQIKKSALPVAVLTNSNTASSAEAVTAIFAGQANVKIIGKKTNGLTSTNSFNFLEDNSALNLTIGYYANRDQQIYRQGISPDIEVIIDAESRNSDEDVILKKALDWINN